MNFSATQIAKIVQGTIQGSAEVQVHTFAKIEEATNGTLCFLANPKYQEYLYTTQASIVLINNNLQLKQAITPTLIRVPDAYNAFATLLKTYQQLTYKPLTGIESPSYISPTATIAQDVYIGAFTYISDKCKIGNNTQIYPNSFIGKNVTIGNHVIIYAGVKIYDHCHIGNHVIIHAGSVIGSDGFGFSPNVQGEYEKIPQLGNVVIEDNVEIGANCTIDRATMGSTLLMKGCKLDNLVQIAHNVQVGNHTVIAAQAGISGSTKIGNYVMIGGQAGIVGHISIANQTKINAQSGVAKAIIEPNTAITGSPAHNYKDTLKSQVIFRKLPELQAKLNELEKKITNLEKK